ncbi:MAG: LptF/LptG family permease [Kiritimatiellae bacterium]|nr:LptF/LptG family permease [Kiritimatiellia bacterium]
MKTLERYVFGSFFTAFFLAFLVLSFVLTIGLMVQITSYILDGIPLGLVGRFALVCIPETMQWTIPLALLVSSVLTFSRMSADSEIAAMRACGVNLLTVMRWPLAFALCATLLGVFINNEIVPRGHEVRRNLAKRLTVGNGLDLLQPGHVIDDFPKAKAYFDRKDGEWLYGLVVTDNTDPHVERLITASKAQVRSEGRDIRLDLHDVTIEPMDAHNPGMGRAGKISYVIKDALKSSTYKRREKDYRFWEMLAEIFKAERAARDAASDVRLARFDADEEHAATARKMRKSMKKHISEMKTEFAKRLVFAFASICFVLVGAPLGIRAQRKESTIGMAVSLAVALGYYLVAILTGALDTHAELHPWWLIWLPVAVCFALAAYLIPKNL